ncbi:MAG TPA: hypothetical protein VNG69_18015, partial [Casimicrobiaceae bacterium]|nr:hypothetical protein [Casimicrobiaceae bacterium]
LRLTREFQRRGAALNFRSRLTMRFHLMHPLRIAALAFGIGLSGLAQASSTLTNFSDLWWSPNEAGWGLNIAQQSDVMFLTFYVYGRDSQPVWYTALLFFQGQQASGAQLYSGAMFRSAGPSHGGIYDPSRVTTTPVGQAQFLATSINNATVSYQINDVNGPISTSRPIERFLLKQDTLAGNYLGGTSDVTSQCTNPSNNGIISEEAGPFVVIDLGTRVEIRGPVCSYVGNKQQLGQVTSINTTYTCTTGAVGSASFFDLRVEPGGISGRYTGVGSNCVFTGNIGLGRRK